MRGRVKMYAGVFFISFEADAHGRRPTQRRLWAVAGVLATKVSGCTQTPCRLAFLSSVKIAALSRETGAACPSLLSCQVSRVASWSTMRLSEAAGRGPGVWWWAAVATPAPPRSKASMKAVFVAAIPS
ncbi:hypothetical protein O3P69_009469 [Scylla paramamosain]|uniref:Uncharacterized protein n=1 Tax=Scylla paramamosain TaxID=85552 RepID=A0AAW0SUN0_SCYPA